MTATQPLTTPHGSTHVDRSIVLLGAGLAAVIVVALVAAVAIGNRSAAYPVGSPEAAFVAYLEASDGGDVEAAYATLSPAVRASWTYDEYAQQRSWYGDPDDRRVVYIDGVDQNGDRATLRLTVEHSYGTGLTASRWTETGIRIRMARVDGTWYVDQPLIGLQEMFEEK